MSPTNGYLDISKIVYNVQSVLFHYKIPFILARLLPCLKTLGSPMSGWAFTLGPECCHANVENKYSCVRSLLNN